MCKYNIHTSIYIYNIYYFIYIRYVYYNIYYYSNIYTYTYTLLTTYTHHAHTCTYLAHMHIRNNLPSMLHCVRCTIVFRTIYGMALWYAYAIVYAEYSRAIKQYLVYYTCWLAQRTPQINNNDQF